MSPTHDVIVLGAGAAGLMLAAEAGRRGKRVLVIERADRPPATLPWPMDPMRW